MFLFSFSRRHYISQLVTSFVCRLFGAEPVCKMPKWHWKEWWDWIKTFQAEIQANMEMNVGSKPHRAERRCKPPSRITYSCCTSLYKKVTVCGMEVQSCVRQEDLAASSSQRLIWRGRQTVKMSQILETTQGSGIQILRAEHQQKRSGKWLLLSCCSRFLKKDLLFAENITLDCYLLRPMKVLLLRHWKGPFFASILHNICVKRVIVRWKLHAFITKSNSFNMSHRLDQLLIEKYWLLLL